MPTTKKQYIVQQEGIMGGAPVIVGTRIPAERLAALIRHGYTEDHLKKEFPHVAIVKLRGALAELVDRGLRSLGAA